MSELIDELKEEVRCFCRECDFLLEYAIELEESTEKFLLKELHSEAVKCL